RKGAQDREYCPAVPLPETTDVYGLVCDRGVHHCLRAAGSGFLAARRRSPRFCKASRRAKPSRKIRASETTKMNVSAKLRPRRPPPSVARTPNLARTPMQSLGRHADRIVSGFRSDYHLRTPATQNGSTVYSFPFLRTTAEEGQGRPNVMPA